MLYNISPLKYLKVTGPLLGLDVFFSYVYYPTCFQQIQTHEKPVILLKIAPLPAELTIAFQGDTRRYKTREEVGELHGAAGVKPKTRKRLPRLMVSGFLSGVFG